MNNRMMSALRTNHKKVIAMGVAIPAALTLAGGSAVAAAKITSMDIMDRTIKAWDMAESAVGSYEVRDRTLRGLDVRKNSLGQSVLTPGLRDKVNGVNRYEIVGRGTDTVTLSAGETAEIVTLCASADSAPAQQAEVAFGGGAKATAGTITVVGSYPHAVEQVSEPSETDPAGRWGARGWAVQVTAGLLGATVQPYVVCAAAN